ncbi:MAG TPA: hypothetical protein VFS60_09570 [Thermoanaerobaculia bacterium]|nr:hypothetical protein [Thermoanaerobaculia bacterium]
MSRLVHAPWAIATAVTLLACSSGAPPAPAPVASATPAAATSPEPEPAAAPSPAPSPPPEAPSTASDPAPTPTPPYRNTVRWSTASEVDNFGYDVYRGPTAEGPFERLTKDPVPGAGTTDEPQKYSFVDESIDPYETYFYYVESISLAGARARFTPVIQAKPKLPRPPSR